MHTVGTLWVIATPIGNLEDLSPRAQKMLAEVALIAAEDTRHSHALLTHYSITTRCLALHEHNERDQCERLIAELLAGKDIALISDAGTPLISDPGFRLVRAARAANITVRPIPGPCAAIAALSVAGLPSDRFVFEGFLPTKSPARQARLRELSSETGTLIFYESSHRICQSLGDCVAIFGAERPAVLARELTKLFETVLTASLAEVLAKVEADANQQRGEFVLIIGGAKAQGEAMRLEEGRRVFALLRTDLPPSQAAKLAAAITGAPRKALYAFQQEK